MVRVLEFSEEEVKIKWQELGKIKYIFVKRL